MLIESPQYPRGLWLHLVDEAGDALTGIRVEYQGRPDSLVAIHCVDPVGGVQETLVWTRPEGDPLRLTLKPKEAADLPTGIASIDWQIDPSVGSLLEPMEEIRLIGWGAVAAFLREHWQGQTERVAVQLDTRTTLSVDLDHSESTEMLVNYLQDHARTSLGEINLSAVQVLLDAQVFKSVLALPEEVIILSTSFIALFENSKLEKTVLRALNRLEGPITLSEAATLTRLSVSNFGIRSLADIKHCVALQYLFLGGNQIADLTPLTGLKNLETLFLNGNRIVDLTPLKQLTSLRYLDLYRNQIVDLTPLANLNNLQKLYLGRNQIVDLTPLANLNLQRLWLEGNQIQDLSPLIANFRIDKGDEVLLSSNPLNDQALNEHIPALRARGVTVSY